MSMSTSTNRGEKRRRTEDDELNEDVGVTAAAEFTAAAAAATMKGIESVLGSKSSQATSASKTQAVIFTPEEVAKEEARRKNFQDMLQLVLDRPAAEGDEETEKSKGRFATGDQIDKEVDDAFKLEVKGYGQVSLPITAKAAKDLIAIAKPSPFGQKEATVYNKNVRNSFQLEPSQLVLSAEWLRKLHEHIFARVNEELALRMTQPEELELHLYKMLLYERGGHFSKHRDTEKESNMFGTFVLVLPSDFAGGILFVEQDNMLKTYFNADTIRRTGRSEWAAFFTDCEHELKPVTSGYRVALSFNMVRKANRAAAVNASNLNQAQLNKVVELLNYWRRQDRMALGIMLKHQYSTAFIQDDAPTSLKGVDVDTFALVQAAVSQLKRTKSSENSCGSAASSISTPSISIPSVALQLCSIKVSESGWFDGGEPNEEDRETESRHILAQGFAPGSYLEAMLGAKAQQQLTHLILPLGEDESKLFEEKVEYTGNEGTNFERFYHRTAIVLIDAENPWRFLRESRFERAAVIFAEAVDALVSGAAAYYSSPVRCIIAANSNATSPIIQCADFACSVWERVQKQHEEDSRYLQRANSSYQSLTRGKRNAIDTLQFADSLLQLRDHSEQVQEVATTARVENLVKELLRTKLDWFRRNESVWLRRNEPLTLGVPVAAFLARLSKWNAVEVKKWLQARQMEASDKMHFLTEVAKLPKIHPSLLGPDLELPRNVIVEMVLALFVKQVRESPQERLIDNTRAVASVSSVSAAGAASAVSPPAEVAPISASELATHLPTPNELAAQSPDNLLKYIVLLVTLSLDESSDLDPALSVLVRSIEIANITVEFIRKKLHSTLMELSKDGHLSNPLKQLFDFTVTQLDHAIRMTTIPSASSYWTYAASEMVSSCRCGLCYEVLRFLESNKCVQGIKGAEKLRRHISNHWCSRYSSTVPPRGFLLEQTLTFGSPHTLVLCKPNSTVEVVHNQCRADMELLRQLRGVFGSERLQIPSFPYDVSTVEQLILQLQVEASAAFRTDSRNLPPAKKSKW